MKILLVSVNASTFVLKDYYILKSNFETTLCLFTECSAKKLLGLIYSHDVVIFWFASIRFFLPLCFAKILQKKIVTIAGGYDVSKVQDGSMQSFWKSFLIINMLKFSDEIVAISKSSFNEIISNCNIKSHSIELIYHGFNKVKRIDFTKKKDRILTIGYIDESSFSRKGIDKFFELAKVMKKVEFHFIGTLDINNLRVEIPENIVQHGYLQTTDENFIHILEQCKVYFQLSRHESFGCSVAEAMQYGCIPIVSNLYSLPEVVGDSGIIIKDINDTNNIKSKIENVFQNYDEVRGYSCVEQINNNFSLEERSSKLIALVKNLA